MWRRETSLQIVFRGVTPCRWGYSYRSFGETCWPDFQDTSDLSWVWRRKIPPKRQYLSVKTTRHHTTKDKKINHRCENLKFHTAKSFTISGKEILNSCIISSLKDISTVAKRIQLPGISLEHLQSDWGEWRQKTRSTFFYGRESSHNENNLYITQPVKVYRHLYKGPSSYDKATERQIRRKWI
jgi:hypothetical protein